MVTSTVKNGNERLRKGNRLRTPGFNTDTSHGPVGVRLIEF